MNVLYIIYKYLDIKAGNKPKRPITMIFGAKAAPAYIIAKDIIHVILCLQELIKNDPEVAPYLQVVMVENYNVTMAEKLIPACEVSEQISLASKEASGTGNMKFMLNGAVTLGTEDGANVEIHQLVGDENIYIFGESSDQVIEHYAKSDYVAADYYINDKDIRKWVDFIISPEMLKIGDVRTLLEIHAELIQKDWFMTLLDVKGLHSDKRKSICRLRRPYDMGKEDDREHCKSRILLIRSYDRRVQQRYLACIKCVQGNKPHKNNSFRNFIQIKTEEKSNKKGCMHIVHPFFERIMNEAFLLRYATSLSIITYLI